MAHLRVRSGMVSATTLAVLGISGVLVLAGGIGFVGISGTQPPAGSPAPSAKSPADTQSTPPATVGVPEGSRASASDPRYVLGFTVKDIDGQDVDLTRFAGKVVIMVNVASKCGFTSQYEGLEKLYSQNKDKGLVVLGFPANNFNGQEPGAESVIKEFCSSKFGVTFPMFSKVSVKGDDAHELYRALASQPVPIGGAPKWNFTKFVVDRSGNVVARYDAARENVGKADLEKDLLKKVSELLAAGAK